jgi:hypothetical protein
MAETIEELLARADAAIAEARLLTAIDRAWQDRTRAYIDRMSFRAYFPPDRRRVRYPQDIKDRGGRNFQASMRARAALLLSGNVEVELDRHNGAKVVPNFDYHLMALCAIKVSH